MGRKPAAAATAAAAAKAGVVVGTGKAKAKSGATTQAKNAAASTASQAAALAGNQKGALFGMTPGSPGEVDLFHPDNSIEYLFGSLTGGPLVEAILSWYQVCELDVPWFSQNTGTGEAVRNVIRSPLSRELQQCTVAAYAERIQREGLSQIVAGSAYRRAHCTAQSVFMSGGWLGAGG